MVSGWWLERTKTLTRRQEGKGRNEECGTRNAELESEVKAILQRVKEGRRGRQDAGGQSFTRRQEDKGRNAEFGTRNAELEAESSVH